MIRVLNFLFVIVSILYLTSSTSALVNLEYESVEPTESTYPFNTLSFDPLSFWTTTDSFVLYYEETETVMITGAITIDTYYKFSNLSGKKIKNVIIASPGGKLLPAIEIAKIISNKKIDTIIPNNSMCYSACTIIFQSGKNRFAYDNAMLMYHSATSRNNPESIPVPSASATALYWAYLVVFGIDDKLFHGMDLGTDYYITPELSMSYNIVNRLIVVDKEPKT